MPYQLNARSSLDTLRDFVVGRVAALSAHPETEPFVQPWLDLEAKLGQAIAERDRLRRDLLIASARVEAFDARWDAALLELSGQAYLQAGRDARRAPYAPLFGTVRASAAARLGPYKAIALGRSVVQRARQIGDPALAAPVDALEAASSALEQADAQRSAARRALSTQDLQRDALLDEIERQITRTEVELLTTFPERPGLVRALLAPERPARSARRHREQHAPPPEAAEPLLPIDAPAPPPPA